MEKINGRARCGFLVKRGMMEVSAVIAEVGFFSAFVAKQNEMISFVNSGYLCRSKVRYYSKKIPLPKKKHLYI